MIIRLADTMHINITVSQISNFNLRQFDLFWKTFPQIWSILDSWQYKTKLFNKWLVYQKSRVYDFEFLGHVLKFQATSGVQETLKEYLKFVFPNYENFLFESGLFPNCTTKKFCSLLNKHIKQTALLSWFICFYCLRLKHSGPTFRTHPSNAICLE